MSLLFNRSRFVIAFLPRSNCLLLSCLYSPTAVILKPKKIKFLTVSIVSSPICHELMGPDLPLGFPCSSAGKESACNAGDLGLIPGLGRSPREGKAYPFQYSDSENSTDCIVHGVTKSRTQLSDLHYPHPPVSTKIITTEDEFCSQ